MSELDQMREAIVQRAVAELGTPFRLFGRTAGKALDCVGLVWVALGHSSNIDLDRWVYGLRGDQSEKARSCLALAGYREINPDEGLVSGDLVLAFTGPSQLHFLIHSETGWVHADAGLGRVVLRPGPLEWPVRFAWRLDRI